MCPQEMDEEELEEYLNAVFGDSDPFEAASLRQPLVDDDGFRVPGCYRVSPAPTD